MSIEPNLIKRLLLYNDVSIWLFRGIILLLGYLRYHYKNGPIYKIVLMKPITSIHILATNLVSEM